MILFLKDHCSSMYASVPHGAVRCETPPVVRIYGEPLERDFYETLCLHIFEEGINVCNVFSLNVLKHGFYVRELNGERVLKYHAICLREVQLKYPMVY